MSTQGAYHQDVDLIGTTRTKVGTRRPPPFTPKGPLPLPQQGRSLPLNQKDLSRSLSSFSSTDSLSPSLSSTSDSSYEEAGSSIGRRPNTRRSARRKGPYDLPSAASTSLPISRRSTHNAIERARRESLAMELSDLARMLPSLEDVKRPSKLVIVQAAIREINQLRERVLQLNTTSMDYANLPTIKLTSPDSKMPTPLDSKLPTPPHLQVVEDDDDAMSTITNLSSNLAPTTFSSPILPDFEDIDLAIHSNHHYHTNKNDVLHQTLTILPLSTNDSSCTSTGLGWSESIYHDDDHQGGKMKPSADLQSALLLQPLFDDHHETFDHGLGSKDQNEFLLFDNNSNAFNVISGPHDVGSIEDLFWNA